MITSSSVATVVASSRPGMGSIPYKEGAIEGTTFRVWAPFADRVCVAGSFNGWDRNMHPLAKEGNGYWSADVEKAKIGDEYRYVIFSSFTPAAGQWRTDPYCKNVRDNDTGNGVIVSDKFDWGASSFNMPSWNELVIYELHIASFRRAQSPDQTLKGPGNLAAVVEKLQYLKDLGINAIELLPIVAVSGPFSLGYNPALPFDIESTFGGPENFKAFIKTAHEYGIAVILDVVYNHYGPEDLETSLWQFDGWNENGRGGIYFYNDWRHKTAFGDRPDLGRGEIRQFIRDNAFMWLDEYRLDGLRFDSTVNIRNVRGNNNDPAHDIPEGWGLMQWINNELDSKAPWKITIAEDLQGNDWITRSTGAGGAGFDTQWGSYFYWQLFNAVVAPADSSRNMYSIRDAILHRFESDAWKRVIYSENHDEVAEINNKVRLPDAIWRGRADSWASRKRSTLAAALVFTSPGIPMIFQGQEFLEWGSWKDNVEIDWSKKDTFNGIWDLYQSLIRLRRNWQNNTRGLRGQYVNVHHVNDSDKVIAFHRWDNGGPGDDVVVVVNMAGRSYNSYSIGFPGGGLWSVRFNSDWKGYSPDFGDHAGYDTVAYGTSSADPDGMPFRGNVGIGPYSVLILSQ